jgi:ribonuclease-3
LITHAISVRTHRDENIQIICEHTVQETTFHSAIQADGLVTFTQTSTWLNAFFSQASQKKFDQTDFFHLISREISFELLEKNISYTFLDKKNLIQSLLQSTFCYEMKSFVSNERLEFAGDSLVNMLIGLELYRLYPTMDEGDLSKLRGSLVNESKLAELARSIHLGNFIFVGKGEHRDLGNEKDSILADCLEALLAAVYFDSQENLAICKQTLFSIIARYETAQSKKYFDRENIDLFDPKSKLQEWTMKEYGKLPEYVSQFDETNQIFTTSVMIENQIHFTVTGPSKKKNEKKCAKEALESLLK